VGDREVLKGCEDPGYARFLFLKEE